MQCFEKIRKQNIIDYGEKVGSWIHIIINQYSDRTHFIYEILQNAEDADATEISFKLYKDRFEIYHNGRPFNEDDIRGVSGIANGTKDDGTRIGHFGIGFKAVYGYTETPIIYSDKYNFEIKNFVLPYEVESKSGLDKKTTCMILPFNKDSVSKAVAYKEIKEALTDKITAESILMLNSISEVNISIEGMATEYYISKEKRALDDNGNVYEMNLMTRRGTKEEYKDFLFFTDAEIEATAIIFRVDLAIKELQEVKNSKVYAFFPTAKEAHQNFYIHAPFDTTPARDNFKEGEDFGKHNIRLVNNLGEVVEFAFNWLRDNGYLSFSGFNKVYPIYDGYEKTDILYGIYKKAIDIIAGGEPLIPTNIKGVYKNINEVCVPVSQNIVSVFDDKDLQRLMDNKKLFWIAKEISTTEYVSLKKFFDNNFHLKAYEWRHLVLKMDSSYLVDKSIGWFEKLAGNIESFCVKRYGNTHYIDVSGIPLVRTSVGKQICARKDGKLQVYLNNPDACIIKIDQSFLNNETIKSFYERALGIPDYNIERETIDKILPKYASKPVAFKTADPFRENIEDLKEVKEAIRLNASVIEIVKDSYILTDGEDWYKPTSLYLKSFGNEDRTGYSLIRGVYKIRYISDHYGDYSTSQTVQLDDKFFEKIGCSKGIRQKQVTEGEYKDAIVKYLGHEEWKKNYVPVIYKKYHSSKFNWQFGFEYPIISGEMTKEKSIQIMRFLNSHCTDFDIKGDLVGAEDQNFSGKNVESIYAYSYIGAQISFEKWVYVKGSDEPKAPIDVDRNDILEDYASFKRILNMLPFVEVKNELFNYFQSVYTNQSDLDLIKRIISNSADLLDLAKAKAKSDAKKEGRKTGSLSEQLARADVEQKEVAKDTEAPDINPISEKGLDKRTKKLEEDFKESMEQKVSLVSGVHWTSRVCSEGERAFLYAEYAGSCQICGNIITKYNGENYFEAINMLRLLKDEHNGAVDTGWNSLCLCPNCAAKYNYCSKKVSDIKEQIEKTDVIAGSEDPIYLEIELPQGNPQRIRYTPRHFLALKTAFKIFAKDN